MAARAGIAGTGPKVSLRTLLAVVALAALLCAALVPLVRLLLGTPNGWVVRTVRRPDGMVVRQRIRRYPNRDVVFEQVLDPAPAAPRDGELGSGP
jgi:hypothetical protein